MSETKYGIVVGFDGSADGGQAVEWAIDEAVRRKVPLTLCHVWQIPYPGIVVPPTDQIEEAARLMLARGLDKVHAAAPEVTVRQLLVCGSAARTLAGFGPAAEMVVVGARGAGGMRELMLGSVSAHVASHATGPVVVARGRLDAPPEYYPGRIVVGADGSPGADRALAFAFEEAYLRQLPLTAVCAWDPASHSGGALAPFVGRDELYSLVDDRFHQAVARWQDKYPKVDVRVVLTGEPPVEAMLGAASSARLMVVGSRGLGAVRGMLLGSVSHALLHKAPCPVAVLHSPAH